MKKMHSGFTLAEVLVTLGVISVIATITLPLINNIKPNQEQIMLKKAYYLIGRNVTELVNDDDFYRDIGTEDKAGFANTERISYHGKFYGNNTAGDEANKKFCELFAVRMNIKEDVNCSKDIKLSTKMLKETKPEGHFTTTDGMVWIMPISNFPGTNYQSIYIDVNGEKGPNCFSKYAPTISDTYKCTSENAGPDRFEVRVDKYGKLTVPDIVSKIYLRRNDTSKNYSDVLKHEMQIQKVQSVTSLK